MTDLPGTQGQSMARWQGWEFSVNGIFEFNGEVLIYGFGEMNHPDGAFTLPFAPSLNVTNGTVIPLFWNITKNVWNNPVISEAQIFGADISNDGGLPIVSGDTSNVRKINIIETNSLGWVLACDERGCEVIASAPVSLGACSDITFPSDFAYPVDVVAFQTGRFTQRRGLVTGYNKDGTSGFWIVDNNCVAIPIGISPLTIDAPLEILGAPRQNNWVYEVNGFTGINRSRFTTTVTLSATAINYEGYDLDGERLSCSGAAIATNESFDIEYVFTIVNISNTPLSIIPSTFCDFERCGLLDAWIIGCQGNSGKNTINEESGWYAPANDLTQVEFSPNPAVDRITITANVEGQFDLTLTDLVGRTVHEANFMSNSEIQLGNLPKGIYIITVTNDKGFSFSDRLIIQ